MKKETIREGSKLFIIDILDEITRKERPILEDNIEDNSRYYQDGSIGYFVIVWGFNKEKDIVIRRIRYDGVSDEDDTRMYFEILQELGEENNFDVDWT